VQYKNKREENDKTIADVDYVDVTYSLFHFLKNHLEWSENAQKYEKQLYKFGLSKSGKRNRGRMFLKLSSRRKQTGYIGNLFIHTTMRTFLIRILSTT
jgi:hypothetical protein